MDLGNTCHNGDVYVSSSKTYSTADGGTSKQMAALAYWFDEKMERSNRAYIMTQEVWMTSVIILKLLQKQMQME